MSWTAHLSGCVCMMHRIRGRALFQEEINGILTWLCLVSGTSSSGIPPIVRIPEVITWRLQTQTNLLALRLWLAHI